MKKENIFILSFLVLSLVSVFLSFFQLNTNVSARRNPDASLYIIKIEGEIHSGRSTYQSTGADTILAKLRSLERKPEIKGLLLEINSPGGTVAASQEIYQELMHLRKTKKIVVSMKDLAASGGYYIASAADYIFAEPGTITGSIGVITMSPNVSGLLEKYNVSMRVYKAGRYKDMLSMFRDALPEENRFIQNLLSDTYTQFISDVAKGRKLEEDLVRDFAEGKIYSGSRAKKLKLVDELGGRREARDKLSELCGYKEALPVIEEDESPFDRFMHLLNTKFSGIQTGKDFIFQEFRNQPVLVLFPFWVGHK